MLREEKVCKFESAIVSVDDSVPSMKLFVECSSEKVDPVMASVLPDRVAKVPFIRFIVSTENYATESMRELVNATSSMVVWATWIVDCSVAEINCRSGEVTMFLIVVPVIAKVDRITVIKGSSMRLLPSMMQFVIAMVPKKEVRNAF